MVITRTPYSCSIHNMHIMQTTKLFRQSQTSIKYSSMARTTAVAARSSSTAGAAPDT